MKKFSFSLNHKIIAGGAEPESPASLSDFLASVRRQTAEIRTPQISTPGSHGGTPASQGTPAFQNFLAQFRASTKRFSNVTSHLTAISKIVQEVAHKKDIELHEKIAEYEARNADLLAQNAEATQEIQDLHTHKDNALRLTAQAATEKAAVDLRIQELEAQLEATKTADPSETDRIKQELVSLQTYNLEIGKEVAAVRLEIERKNAEIEEKTLAASANTAALAEREATFEAQLAERDAQFSALQTENALLKAQQLEATTTSRSLDGITSLIQTVQDQEVALAAELTAAPTATDVEAKAAQLETLQSELRRLASDKAALESRLTTQKKEIEAVARVKIQEIRKELMDQITKEKSDKAHTVAATKAAGRLEIRDFKARLKQQQREEREQVTALVQGMDSLFAEKVAVLNDVLLALQQLNGSDTISEEFTAHVAQLKSALSEIQTTRPRGLNFGSPAGNSSLSRTAIINSASSRLTSTSSILPGSPIPRMGDLGSVSDVADDSSAHTELSSVSVISETPSSIVAGESAPVTTTRISSAAEKAIARRLTRPASKK